MKNILYISILLILIFASCKKEKIYTSSDAKLVFSHDTVFFDTLFSNIGSATKQIKIYNRNHGTVNISAIRLAGGENSNFRLNINGVSTNKLNDVELEENDSLYIFIEVTIDPNNDNLPYIVQDSIVFEVNGNVQDLDLISWGQNANYIDGRYNSAIIGDTTWTNNKPFLIYNSMMVDSGKTLIIEDGTQIFLHKNSNIYVLGTLIINGTKQNPVIIKGDRLDNDYDDMPGQWGRLVFINPSKNNVINYAEIKGGVIGVQVGGNIESSEQPDLKLSNTKVEHMNYAGLYTIGSKVIVSNCVFADAGYYAVALLMGGEYEFYHTTISNYWNFSTRTEPSLIITNNLVSDNIMYVKNLTNAYFGNCIIYGSLQTELGFSNDPSGTFVYKFENCILKAGAELNTSDVNNYLNVWKDKNPKFVSIEKYNWQLDTLSQAINMGSLDIINNYIYSPSIIYDLNEQNRTSYGLPDLGAYERVE